MSPEQRQEWEDDEEALRREATAAHAPAPESTESDAKAARVERYAQAIYTEGAYCGECSYESWADCSECRRLCGYYGLAAVFVADSELAEAKREIAALVLEFQGEAQAYRALFAENERLREHLTQERRDVEGLLRVSAEHAAKTVAGEMGPKYLDERLRADRAEAALVESRAQVEAVRALAERWAKTEPVAGMPFYEMAYRDAEAELRAALSSAAADTPEHGDGGMDVHLHGLRMSLLACADYLTELADADEVLPDNHGGRLWARWVTKQIRAALSSVAADGPKGGE